VGVLADDLQPAHVELRAGDRLLVAGSPGSGRSTALVLLATTLGRRADVTVLAVEGRPGSLAPLPAACICNNVEELAARADGVGDGTVVLVVDDADRVDDDRGVLSRLLERHDVLAVVAGRSDALRADYSHWTRSVRRARTGLLLRPDREADGDLLGVTLPRHQIEPERPGRGYLVAGGPPALVQLAMPTVAS
jgi:S-DNA-T family DNA segregation ATPase FtsK/SpoIIIE